MDNIDKGAKVIKEIRADYDYMYALDVANSMAKDQGFKDVEDYWNKGWDPEKMEEIVELVNLAIDEKLKIVWDEIMRILSGYSWKVDRKSTNHVYPMESVASTLYDSAFNGGPYLTICSIIENNLKENYEKYIG